jgi:hypothetical protein
MASQFHTSAKTEVEKQMASDGWESKQKDILLAGLFLLAWFEGTFRSKYGRDADVT